MAKDKPKGFWKRLKDKLIWHKPEAEPQSKPEPIEQPPTPATQDETPAIEPPVVEDPELTPTPEPVQPPSKDEPQSEPTLLSTSELKTDTVGRVYAEALLELSNEQGVTDAIAEQVQGLLPLVAEGGELHRLLTNPAIADSERGAIIQRVFEGKVHDLLYKMMRVLGDKGRLGSLPSFAAGYLLAVAEQHGQVEVVAYVATPLDGSESVRVAEQIGTALGKTVTLTQKVDPALIGGMKIKVGDKLIDASVASQLRNMKNNMIAAGRS